MNEEYCEPETNQNADVVRQVDGNEEDEAKNKLQEESETNAREGTKNEEDEAKNEMQKEGETKAREGTDTEAHEEAETKPADPLDEFPTDCDNPFEQPFIESDVVLIVEGKKLHAHKNILSVYSPVFHRMFKGDFAESRAAEIPIQDTTHDAMVMFLKQMYPVHSLRQITDDTVLENILPLAHYYQSEHILKMCETYIEKQVTTTFFFPQAHSTMLYLAMCDKFDLQKHFDTILNLAAQLRIAEIQQYRFSSLKPHTQVQLLLRRCEIAERMQPQAQPAFNKDRDAVSLVNAYKGQHFGRNHRCEHCDKCDQWICRLCLRNALNG